VTDTTVWVDEHFVGGDLALDFANTVYRRWPEPGPDLVANTDALTAWLTRAQLLPAGGPTATEEILEDARALRAQLWLIFDAQKDDRSIPSHTVTGLTVHADGSAAAEDARGALGIVALRAIRIILEPPPQGVRACDRCGWFFIDSSRGRRRRWCSMNTCGNQAKAARHRSRRQ
jgi:predicted RNA-binding Zn ribbon-like protein